MPYLIFLDPSLSGRLRNNWIAVKILAQKWNQFQLTQHLFINIKPLVKEMFCSQKFWLLFTLQGDLVSGLLRAGLIESELELQDLTTFLSAVYWSLPTYVIVTHFVRKVWKLDIETHPLIQWRWPWCWVGHQIGNGRLYKCFERKPSQTSKHFHKGEPQTNGIGSKTT